MKKVSILSAIVLSSLVIGVTSCKKEDPAKALKVNLEQTATVNGKILINANESDSLPKWSAPQNVQILASVPYNQLNSNAYGNYTINSVNYNPATGEFTVVAPVGVNGSSIDIKIVDFKGTVITPVWVDTAYVNKTINVLWNGTSGNTPYLVPGEVYTLPTFELDGDYSVLPSVGDEI